MQQVRIEGLRELQKALKDLDAAYPRQLREVNEDAAEIIAGAARSRAFALGGVAAHVAPTIKAAAEQRRAKVTLGGPANPEAMGAEFGSNLYLQFQPFRGAGEGAGYFLYPAIRAEREQIVQHYEHALDELTRKHFDK